MALLKLGMFELECDDEDAAFIKSLWVSRDFKYQSFCVKLSYRKDNELKERKMDLAWILTRKVGIVRFIDGNRSNYRKENLDIEEFRNK